jgi:Fe-S-cluster containining protein
MRKHRFDAERPPADGDRSDEATVSVSVMLRIEDQPLHHTFELPAAPVRPLRLLPVLQRFTDEIVSRVVKASEKRGRAVSCREGCIACCKQLIPVTETEAHHLRDLVEDLPEPRRRTVGRRFTQTLERLAEAGLLDAVRDPTSLDDEGLEALGPAYLALGLSCPFLENDRCSIYDDRPLVCREYLVTSDASHCSTPTPETIQRVPIGELSDALSRVDDTTERSIRWVALPLSSEWANANPDERPPRDARILLGTILGHLATPAKPSGKGGKRR